VAIDLQPSSPDRMILSIGPHHPSTHGVLRVVLELEGETIIRAVPEHGFLHTGIEKSAENLNWQQAITVIDRMDYLSPLSNNLAYVLAVEKLLGATEKIPARASAIRVLMSELQRIASHMVFLGTTGLDLGAQSIFFHAFELREDILDIFEEVTGARMNPSYFRVGGLADDLPDNFDEMLTRFLRKAPQRLDELNDILTDNPIWRDRTVGLGVLSAERAISLGLTGPNLRACGIDYDIRKVYPYCGYEQYEFNVPLGKNGDVFDRYLLRLQECYESVKITRQAFDNLPAGPVKMADRKIVLPPKAEVREDMEALIHHFKLVSYGFDVPAGEVYQTVESPRGEIGYYVVSDGTNKPMRVRTRPPSFYTVHALPAWLEGVLIADMVAIIAAADPVFGEVDR
jgi:NADH-quinone oxidoreductase subunit D